MNTLKLNIDKDYWYKFGFEYGGPLYLGLITWLKMKMETENFDKFYFFSRDGWLIKRLFEQIYPDLDYSNIRYLYTSRRMFNISAIFEINELSLKSLKKDTDGLSIAQCFERLGVDLKNIINKNNYDLSKSVSNERSTELFESILLDSEDYLLSLFQKEREALMVYLKSEGLFDAKKIGVFDIGWVGSMQSSLLQLLKAQNISNDVSGLYLGTFYSTDFLNSNKEGFLFTNNSPKKYHELIMKCVEIFELLFSSPENSVLNVNLVDGNTVMAFAPQDSGPDLQEIIHEIHKGITGYLRDNAFLLRTENAKNNDYYREMLYSKLYSLLYGPTPIDIANLGVIEHTSAFGLTNRPKKLIVMKNLDEYKNNLAQVVIDYKNSYWRTGFTKYLEYKQKRKL